MLTLASKEVIFIGGQIKNRTQVGVVMDTEIYKRLKKYSEETMIPMSRIIDKAVTEYLDKQKKK